MLNKIGIIDFNPVQNPDERKYVDRISKLFPQGTEFQGIFFKDNSIDFSNFSALILSGSKLSATDYQNMLETGEKLNGDYIFLDRVVSKLKNYKGPMFGICFGSQIINFMMGGKLGKLSKTEAGYLEHKLCNEGKKDVVFGDLPDIFYGAHLHSDFVKELPKSSLISEADVLAERESYIHIYRIICNDGSIRYGVQAHPEMSNPNDATFLVKVNQSWLEGEIGHMRYNESLVVPSEADYDLSKAITNFVKLINRK